MTTQKLTSVKVDIDSWNNFKKLSIDEKITFRQLVQISIGEFINNKSFRKTIDAEAKRAGLNDEQIKLLYILNGIESRSGTATESAYYSRDRMFEKFGGRPDSSLGRYATRMGWYDANGNIVGESVTTANGKTIPKALWE